MRWLLAAGACAALLLGGCGGGGDTNNESSSASNGTEATATQQANQAAGGQEEGKGKQSGRSPAKAEGSPRQSAKLVKVPPISSRPIAGSTSPAPGVKTAKGGDNSVQEYGTEADEEARTEAAIALQAYLNDRLQEDWQGVCSHLAQIAKDQLQKLTQQLKGKGKEIEGCAAVMALLGKGESQAQMQKDATITEVLSFRGEGDVAGNPSYLIFKAPPAQTLYSMPMYLEGGQWKVGLALPSELPL